MSLKRKTPLRRRTPLKAKTPLRAKKKTEPELGADGFREFAWQRSGGRCECGCGKRLTGKTVSHHVFYKSHISKRVKNQWWNGALILDACHRAIHDQGDKERRERMERVAVLRLQAHIGDSRRLLNLMPVGATAWSAYLRAYELMTRQEMPRAA